jgi:hypothetical protein
MIYNEPLMTLAALKNWSLQLDICSSQLFLQQEKIREHIPTIEDKDATCPKPSKSKILS